MRLKDKTALITGAGSGIGREAALLFSQEGAAVLVADMNEAGGRETVKMVEAQGGRSAFAEGRRLQGRRRQSHGGRGGKKISRKLNILFNNAGILLGPDDDAVKTTEDVWDLTMNVNLKGVFLGCKHGIPALRRAGGGSIINTASFVALLGAATPQVAYTASKGGVRYGDPRAGGVVHAHRRTSA